MSYSSSSKGISLESSPLFFYKYKWSRKGKKNLTKFWYIFASFTKKCFLWLDLSLFSFVVSKKENLIFSHRFFPITSEYKQGDLCHSASQMFAVWWLRSHLSPLKWFKCSKASGRKAVTFSSAANTSLRKTKITLRLIFFRSHLSFLHCPQCPEATQALPPSAKNSSVGAEFPFLPHKDHSKCRVTWRLCSSPHKRKPSSRESIQSGTYECRVLHSQ